MPLKKCKAMIEVKQITDKPFGVNITLSPFADDIVDLVIEEGVKLTGKYGAPRSWGHSNQLSVALANVWKNLE